MSQPAPAPAGRFDLASLLSEHRSGVLDLHERFINPAIVGVLRTIGFDQNWARGQGAYLYDDRGNRYIDCLGGYAVFGVGRNHPVVRDALRQAMELDLPNLPGVGQFRVAPLLARELSRIAPPGLDKVFFASGGAEAVDAAIKFARAATGRNGIIYCQRAYHGLTLGALSACGNHEFRDGFGPLLADTVEIPFNDLAALDRALARRDAAAFIVEPIQGKGVNLPDDNYLREAHALCRRHGALLIADEIQTGMGRTGRMFACEHWGVAPDIMVVAKALSGGYVPVSAVLMQDWIAEKTFASMQQCSRIQNTFSMNDLAMTAGLATLHVMREERTVEHARDIGDYLLAGLRTALGKYEMVREVRGKGLMIAIEFQPPRSIALRMGWSLLHRLDQSLFCQAVIMPLMTDHRILTQVAGHRLDVIKLIPALVLSKPDADEIIAGFDAAIGACHQFPGPAWEVGKKLSAAAAKRFAPGAGPTDPRAQQAAVAR